MIPFISVGFTGTQVGMTQRQREILRDSLQTFFDRGAVVFRHGDCQGADEQAGEIARSIGYKIAVYPPDNPSRRAFAYHDLIKPPRPYLTRNRDIVDDSDVLIATPETKNEKWRSGTWTTVRYARRIHREYMVILP